jgi:HNH endonuclease
VPDEAEDAAIAFLLRLDPVTQSEVLRRFEEVLQRELDTESSRERKVATALHEAKRTLGKPPSIEQYNALRRAHPERGWPDPRSVKRWLGVRSWNDALVRVRLEPVLEGDTIEGALGPIYSVAEVVQAVRDCADDLGRVPTIGDYFAWQRRPDVRERAGRRPASTWVFDRIFGGFRRARVAAGLVEDEPTAAHPSDVVLRSANYRVTDEQILEDIRYAAARTSDPLTARVYDRERRLVYQETKAAGHPRALTGVTTIHRRFRLWPAALEAAGIAKRPRAQFVDQRETRRLSDDQLLGAMSDAYDELGKQLTVRSYAAWRDRQAADDLAKRRALPSHPTIARRFGSWKRAHQEMLREKSGEG